MEKGKRETALSVLEFGMAIIIIIDRDRRSIGDVIDVCVCETFYSRCWLLHSWLVYNYTLYVRTNRLRIGPNFRACVYFLSWQAEAGQLLLLVAS